MCSNWSQNDFRKSTFTCDEANKRKWKANVQKKVRIMVDGKPKRVYVSARALKSGKVERV